MGKFEMGTLLINKNSKWGHCSLIRKLKFEMGTLVINNAALGKFNVVLKNETVTDLRCLKAPNVRKMFGGATTSSQLHNAGW